MSPHVRSRLAWSGALLALLAASALLAEWRADASRTAFARPADMGSGHWLAVQDAGDAIRALGEGGVHVRALVLLSGRWPLVKSTGFETADAPGSADRPPDQIDADTATIAAARLGIARELHAVLLPAAYQARLAQVGAAKGLRRGQGWFELPFHGYPRRFSTVSSFAAPREAVVAVVEPSFFGDGAPADLDAWAAERGLAVEVGLVALADPVASEAQRERAAAFAEGRRALAVEVHR